MSAADEYPALRRRAEVSRYMCSRNRTDYTGCDVDADSLAALGEIDRLRAQLAESDLHAGQLAAACQRLDWRDREDAVNAYVEWMAQR